MRHSVIAPTLRVAGIFVIFAVFQQAGPAFAQRCDRPLCRSGETYQPGSTDAEGAYGSCKHCNWFGYCSHYIARCGEDSTLDLERGVCVLNACSSCGAELPLCDSDEAYTGSGSDRDGVYGVCSSGPSGIGGYRSHQLKRCREGWTLQTDTGMCKKNCAARLPRVIPDVVGPITPIPDVTPPALQLPDLVLRRAWLKAPKGGPIKAVRRGQPYYACFEVANQGARASGPFYVGGGGLGIPTPPEQAHANLAPGAARQGCLYYPTTPAAGTYKLGLTADSRHTVTESREDNNDRTLTVQVNAF